MKKIDPIDARDGRHVVVLGRVLRKFIRERMSQLERDYQAILSRLNNEIPDKEDAVSLMVLLVAADDRGLNERAMFARACAQRAAFIMTELSELATLGNTYEENESYVITTQDAIRYGIGVI
ncbi:hypothetical protein HC928_02630 [bacterium]|nr:hypothetical protein [bacterium]